MSNISLHRAKMTNNDEFYTCYDDIEQKVKSFDFSGKTVYCNCDDWHFSNFFKYFYNNFKKLGLKKLLSTGFNAYGHGFYACYDGKRLVTDEMIEDGDFRSTESWLCLQISDIVVTNPPFSLFREYISFLLENKKQFIIVGTESAITYKNVFPYIMSNKVWIGSELIKKFIKPDGEFVSFGNVCWFTNVISNETKKPLPVATSYSNEYTMYDNYDAIEIGAVKNIPVNYYGVMGVPVSYMKYHNPMEFDIVGVSSSSKENAGEYHKFGTTRPIVNGKKMFTRLFIKRKKIDKLVS